MTDFDLAIVGGGPAGLIAAAYAEHAQLRTGIFMRELGGKVNYPFALRDLARTEPVWGANLVHEFEKRVIDNPKIYHERREVIRITRDEDNRFCLGLASPDTDAESGGKESKDDAVYARAVIIATGAAPQRLYVSGEREYWGRGVSFSAVSHAPFFAGRDVAVVGSGRRALVAALALSSICRHVYFIAANVQTLSDWPEARQVRAQSNISVFSDWEVQQVIGDDFVTGIGLVGANGETRRLAVEGVFVELALLPNNELVRGLVDVDDGGYICVDHRCTTSVPGLFAAGDVTNIHAEQVLVAIGEGAKAALSAWEYLAVHP
jgi:NADH-dependent peroxiredoxin subunit F